MENPHKGTFFAIFSTTPEQIQYLIDTCLLDQRSLKVIPEYGIGAKVTGEFDDIASIIYFAALSGKNNIETGKCE